MGETAILVAMISVLNADAIPEATTKSKSIIDRVVTVTSKHLAFYVLRRGQIRMALVL